jgi:hypothetical protein
MIDIGDEKHLEQPTSRRKWSPNGENRDCKRHALTAVAVCAGSFGNVSIAFCICTVEFVEMSYVEW